MNRHPLEGGEKMTLFKKDPVKVLEEENIRNRYIDLFSKMSDKQLIIAMLLCIDAAHTQILYGDNPLGLEAIKRCGFDPYKE